MKRRAAAALPLDRRLSARALLCLTLALALLAGCARHRATLGEVRLQSGLGLSDPPEVFGVQEGRIFSSRLDATLGADGCVHGPWVLCRQEGGAASEPGATVERWSGADGRLRAELSPDGRRLRLDVSLRGAPPVHALVLLGEGGPWDELRAHPALLGVAAAAARQTTPRANLDALLPSRDQRNPLIARTRGGRSQ